jgi:hypothetical protein
VPSKEKNTDGTGELQLITVLNRDYELPVRILANRMRQTLSTVVCPGQYCEVSSRTMFDVIAVIRKSLAQAQFKKTRLCVLSSDFGTASVKISHQYLFRLLQACGYPTTFFGNTSHL